MSGASGEGRAVRSAELADAEARARIRSDLGATLIVEAAAGTGKTTALVGRILSLVVEGGARLSRVVAVTFTDRAAGEMKLRLRAEIDRARVNAEATAESRERLDQALTELEQARITTIHGLCADLLREYAVEAAVDPLFEVAADSEQDRVYGEAFDRWFQRELANPGEGVRRVLRRKAQGRKFAGPQAELRRAGWDLIGQRDFDAPYRRAPVERERALDELIARLDELARVADEANTRDDYLVKNLLEVGRFLSELGARERVRGDGRDYDGLEAELRGLVRLRSWNWRGSARAFASSGRRAEVLRLRDEVRAELTRTLDLLDADLAACLFADLRPLLTSYEEQKRKAGQLDFVDLLLLTRDLLRSSRAVRGDLQARFSHILVDEFQDTDPLQAEILLLLAADQVDAVATAELRPVAGKLFVVGDPKQSIYRFRRADVALYEAIKRRLLAAGAELLHLTTSFRSAPSIQAAVNAAFAPLMKGSEDGSQADYVALTPFRAEPEGRPTVVALPVPRPYGDYGKVVGFRIDESVPDAVGAFVDFLVRQSGWTVEDASGAKVPVAARHVCLLFKRFKQYGRQEEDVTRPYVRALEARQIPHVLVGGRSLYLREEVLALRNALAAIEWPDDELKVYATLHGPLFAITDDVLLAYRYERRPAGRSGALGRIHPLAPPLPEGAPACLGEVTSALEVLARLHRRRNRRPIADTLAELLEATRAHAGIAIWPTGEQALGNLLRVLDLARRFEASRATSFRSFVLWLEDEAERGGTAEAPIVEEGTDGVRLMTVHKAKGLEFPVVILVDPTAPGRSDRPSRYVDPEKKLWAMPLCGAAPLDLLEKRDLVLRHDREESVRLVYVAATRARDLLVVPVVGDERTGSDVVSGWVDVLHPVLYPSRHDRRASGPAPGCPPFGDDSVFERPPNVEVLAEASVKPGRHRPEQGEHSVVFWDPRALSLGKDDEVGLRQQRILAADESGASAAEGERLHAEWANRRSALLANGAAPSRVVRTVTQLAQEAPAVVAVPRAEIASARGLCAGRPSGRRFGTLVHAVLATVDLRADRGALEALVEAHGRVLGATTEEVLAAKEAARAALGHPLLDRARAASDCRRESPVVVRGSDGRYTEGIIDLAFRELAGGEARWVIVDFKTDTDLGERRATYEAQVALYVNAVRVATGEDAYGWLLLV